MIRCQSRIQKEFKSRKADSHWPISAWPDLKPDAPQHANMKLPECGGKIVITVEIEVEPYMGGEDHRLAISIVCSRCKYPYVDGYQDLRHSVAMGGKLDVTKLLEG